MIHLLLAAWIGVPTPGDVAPDGSRFLVTGPVEDEDEQEPVITLVQGWWKQ